MTSGRRSVVIAMLLVPQIALARHKPPPTYTISLPATPDFSPLSWLVGRWSGRIAGRGPRGTLQLSVNYALDKRVIIFRERSERQAGQATPPAKESWMGILIAPRARQPYTLDVYSSTGFVIRYEVRVTGPEIRFNFSGGPRTPSGWLFRRTIERTGVSRFTEVVQMAPPGRSFFNYYKAQFIRATSGQPSSPTASH